MPTGRRAATQQAVTILICCSMLAVLPAAGLSAHSQPATVLESRVNGGLEARSSSDPSLQPIGGPVLVGTSSSTIAIDQSADKVYVANYYTKNITVISTKSRTQLLTLWTGDRPTQLLDDQRDGLVFALGNPYLGNGACEAPCPENGSVTAFSTSGDVSTGQVTVGMNPVGFAFDGYSDELFVANTLSDNMSMISPHPFGLKSTLGLSSYDLIADPTTSAVYSLETGLPGNVTVIDSSTNTIVRTLQTGGSPYMGVFDPWNKILYVADGNRTQDWVDVISTVTNQLVTKIGLPGEAAQMVIDSLNGDLLVGTHLFSNERQDYAGNFTLISEATNSVITTFVWSPYVYTVVSDNATRAVYFLGYGNLTVFNATTMTPLYSVPVNSSAYLMALDTADDTLYIVNPSYYIGVPGSVNIYAAPLPIPPSNSSPGILGWTDLAIPVAVGSVLAGALIGILSWVRLRSRRA